MARALTRCLYFMRVEWWVGGLAVVVFRMVAWRIGRSSPRTHHCSVRLEASFVEAVLLLARAPNGP